MKPRFYFAVCQTGAEKVVKQEVTGEHPGLRFAFSRPGFVTFKEEDDAAPALVLERGIFTRLWGQVLGQAREPAGLADLLALIPAGSIVHGFDRDLYLAGDEPLGFVRHLHIDGILKDRPGLNEAPRIGDEVYSLIWVDDFLVFLGRHRHAGFMLTRRGNLPDRRLPPESPSRAYLKLEEAFSRFRPPLEKGQLALELGCAPGGATTALLNRGLRVLGVDPQHLDERVAARPGFIHRRKAVKYLTAEDLADLNPDWLVVDMGISPREALAELTHALKLLRTRFGAGLRLRQGFLTLKLNDWRLVPEIPAYLRRLEELGFHDLTPIQLGTNRREFFVRAARFAPPH
jgi:23S rRNA (cytidine2498-2'-O)-methyltransferase